MASTGTTPGMSNEGHVGIRQLPGGITALDLRGYVDKQVVDAVDQAIARLVEQTRNRIVVNCADLTYIASRGVGVLLSHLIKIRKGGGDIKFCAMTRDVRTVVSVLGLEHLIQVHDSEDLAVGEFQRQAREREAKERAPEGDEQRTVGLRFLDGGICVVNLRGFIDRHMIDQLEAGLRRALEEEHGKIVVNCEGVAYIASKGMGVFLAYVPRARARGGDIRFCNMRDQTRTVITMIGMQNYFKIFDAEAEAIASYRNA